MTQYLDALSRGNKIRCARAKLKKEIAAGKVNLPEMLRDTIPECFENMKAEELLRSAPRVGPKKARYFLLLAHCSPVQRCGRITTRQRDFLADLLESSPRQVRGIAATQARRESEWARAMQKERVAA